MSPSRAWWRAETSGTTLSTAGSPEKSVEKRARGAARSPRLRPGRLRRSRLPGLDHRRRRGAFERVEPRAQRIDLVASRSRHRLHRVEFLARDEILAAEKFLELGARIGLPFARHAGKGARGAVHELDEIVENPVFGLHC